MQLHMLVGIFQHVVVNTMEYLFETEDRCEFILHLRKAMQI